MVPWSVLAERHPELAERGARRLFAYAEGLAFLSTPREGDEPCVQPVRPVLEHGSLYVLRTPTRLRGSCIESSESFALQAFPLGGGRGGEFYLAGRAHLVGRPATQAELAQQVTLRGRPDDVRYELRIAWALYSGWERGDQGAIRAVRLQWHAEFAGRGREAWAAAYS